MAQDTGDTLPNDGWTNFDQFHQLDEPKVELTEWEEYRAEMITGTGVDPQDILERDEADKASVH